MGIKKVEMGTPPPLSLKMPEDVDQVSPQIDLLASHMLHELLCSRNI